MVFDIDNKVKERNYFSRGRNFKIVSNVDNKYSKYPNTNGDTSKLE